MIILIDDNKYGQMAHNYRVDFTIKVEDYKDQIMWLTTIDSADLGQLISGASCILIHDSIDNKENKEKLVALCKEKPLPYCVFSNGFTATTYEGGAIKEIKKDRMYNNLIAFIKDFRDTKEINLPILALGSNYDLEKSLIIQDRLINGTLLPYKSNFDYEVAFPSGSQAYKDLNELVYLSDESRDFSSFEDEFNSPETTAQVMRAEIISLVSKVKSKNGKYSFSYRK